MVNTLYHQVYHGILSRYLDLNEVYLSLEEVCVGIYDSHMSRMVLAKQLLRVGYYWHTFEHDSCSEIIKRLLPCQQNGNMTNSSVKDLQPVTPP